MRDNIVVLTKETVSDYDTKLHSGTVKPKIMELVTAEPVISLRISKFYNSRCLCSISTIVRLIAINSWTEDKIWSGYLGFYGTGFLAQYRTTLKMYGF